MAGPPCIPTGVEGQVVGVVPSVPCVGCEDNARCGGGGVGEEQAVWGLEVVRTAHDDKVACSVRPGVAPPPGDLHVDSLG